MRGLVVLTVLAFSYAVSAVSAPTAGLDTGMVNPGYHDKPEWFKQSFLDLRDDVAEAAGAGRRVLLYFYQDGCPYCAKLLHDNLGDRALADKTRAGFDVIAVNLWGDREVTDMQGLQISEKAFAGALRVQYTPTLVFLNEQGQTVLRLNGYLPPRRFAAALDYVAGHHEGAQRFSDFVAAREPMPVAEPRVGLAAALMHPLRLAERVDGTGRALLVLFEQSVCASCDELHGEVLVRREVAYALSNLDVAVIDMRSNEPVQTPDGRVLAASAWARELGVHYAPSLVFFDSGGTEVFRTEAYLKAFHIHGAIDYVATAAYRRQPNFQRFLQHRTEVLHARGVEVDLMH